MSKRSRKFSAQDEAWTMIDLYDLLMEEIEPDLRRS